MNNQGTKEPSDGTLRIPLPDWKRVHVPADVDQLARSVVDAAFAVHKELGPGLLESAYEVCLSQELQLRGIRHVRQTPIQLNYKGSLVEVGFRADLIIEDKLLVELKAIEKLLPLHTAQVVTYLRLKKFPLGLLINFNEVLIKHGIHRVLNVPRNPQEVLT